MGRENRFKNLQTRLNEQTKLCKLQSKTRRYKFQIIKQSCFKNLAKYSQNYPYQAQIQSFQLTSSSKIHNQNGCFITQIVKEQNKLQFLVNKSIFGTTKRGCFCHVPRLAATKFHLTCPYNSFWKLPAIAPHQAFTENIIFERKK